MRTKGGWFEALGNPVPEEQRERARKEAREMGYTEELEWVDDVAEYVEMDRPEEAIEEVKGHLDLTGLYRFLAYLCVDVPDTCVDCGEELSKPAVTEHRGRGKDLEFCSMACHANWRHEYSLKLLQQGRV